MITLNIDFSKKNLPVTGRKIPVLCDNAGIFLFLDHRNPDHPNLNPYEKTKDQHGYGGRRARFLYRYRPL